MLDTGLRHHLQLTGGDGRKRPGGGEGGDRHQRQHYQASNRCNIYEFHSYFSFGPISDRAAKL
jgi:hypothetical protein